MPERPLSEIAPRQAVAAEGARHVRCSQCGAESAQPVTTASFACIYCLAELSVVPDTEVLEFDALVPFRTTPQEASSALFATLKAAWFAPNGLASGARVEKLRSTYLPIWQLSGRFSAHYEARIGILTSAADDRAMGHARPAGDPGHVRTRFEKVRGELEGDFRQLESASRVITTRELGDLGDFGLERALVRFDTGYLAEHEAEFPTVAAEPALTRAKEQLQRDQEAAAKERLAHADEIKKLDIELATSEEHGRLVLVPVYVVACRFRGEVFRMLVNGQSGVVQGDYPVSGPKVLSVLALFAAAVGYLWWRLA